MMQRGGRARGDRPRRRDTKRPRHVKQVSRSIWGVVPDVPRYKEDLRPELIWGSAVAVAEGAQHPRGGTYQGDQREEYE